MDELRDDLLMGARAIAEFMGIYVRRVFYLAEHGKIPVFKLGERWHARRSTLRRFVETKEAAALEGCSERPASPEAMLGEPRQRR
jgi:hypothetical protein